jgi:O-antigen ligase
MASVVTPSVVVTACEGVAPLLHEGSYAPASGTELAGIKVVLAGLLLAAPLAFGAVQPWAWGALGLAASVLLLWWAATRIRQGVVRLVWSSLYLPGALFLLLGAVQLAAHHTPDMIGTREALLKLGTDVTFFFLATQIFSTSRGTWHKLGLMITGFAFVLALFAILQFFSSADLIYWRVKPRWGGWIFGPYVNHNHYAGLMEMLIPVACGYVLTRRLTRAARLLAAVTVLIPAASVLLSGSRGGFIALLVESLLFFAVLFGSVPADDGRTLAAGLGLAAATTGLLFVWMDPGGIAKHLATVFERQHSRQTEVGFETRATLSLDSLRILRDHPWLGVGLGSFEVAYSRHQSFPSDKLWDHAHDDCAEALAESGLVGGALMATAIALFFRLAFADLRARLRCPGAWLQLGAAVGCCGLLVHSLFDFNLHIPANAAWFAVCAALATCGSPLTATTVPQSSVVPSPTLGFRTPDGKTEGLTDCN